MVYTYAHMTLKFTHMTACTDLLSYALYIYCKQDIQNGLSSHNDQNTVNYVRSL
jgi:hypothetical protein